MAASALASSQPSVSCSPDASFTPSTPTSKPTPFTLAHSPLFPAHTRARSSHPAYPARFAVSDERLDFAAPWNEYEPADFTAPSTAKHSPDPVDPTAISASVWHCRPSSHAFIVEDESGRPLNPFGRTGLRGRGKLYYWGANHAADCILLRRRRDSEGSGQRQLLVIQRGDTGELALVGGMIDKGETPEQCIKREFGEEALGIPEQKHDGDDDSSSKSGATAEQQRVLDAIFAPSNTRCVYRGYVDDARNTDNAWMETAAFAYDLPRSVSDEQAERLFVGGSDASAVKWVECGEEGERLPQLYASHGALVKLALQQRASESQDSVAGGTSGGQSKM